MIRALRFRRRLTVAGIFILCILFLAFYFAYRSAAQSEGMNRWVAHTQEVLETVAQARLNRAWLKNEVWGYRETHDSGFRQRFQEDRRRLDDAMKKLRQLTADNPSQQGLLAVLIPAISIYETLLEDSMQKSTLARAADSGATAESLIDGSLDAQIRQLFENIESNERTLLASRSQALSVSARQTRHVILLAGLLSFAILIVAGHLIQREIMTRERIEDGLRRTEGLLREKAAALATSEDEQRKQNAILRSVLDSMAEGVVVADEEGHFTLFNPAAEHILGAGPADIPPGEWSQYYQAYKSDHTTLFPTEELPLVRALRGETTDNVQIYVRNRQHPQISCISASGRPLIATEGRISGAVVVFHDITEVLEANRELEAFTYSVSHDLRAPLRHMEGFSRLLQKDQGDKLSTDARHYLDRIQSAAAHMSSLVEDLLHLSQIGRQVPQRNAIPLRALAEEVRAEFAEETEGRLIDWRISPLPEVQGDPLLVRQVLFNLFSNAVKFTRRQNPAVIEVGSREEAGETVIYVRDNGAGFDPRYADKLFGVFQRLHRQDEFEGTGIGLALVQRIIHKHGGRVWADSLPGQGATFYFTLPARAESRVQTQELAGARA
jgi:PAS domain S-box-containing protein